MEEIEAKFKIENKSLMLEKLKGLDVEHQKIKHQVDTYFKHSKSEELKDVPSYLRIRCSDGVSKIAMHYKKEAYNWEEIELIIQDRDKMFKIFKNLGFEVDIVVDKIRRTFILKDVEFVIDEVKDLGLFFEIEAKNKELLFKYCKLLGFTYGEKDPLEGKSYADLVRENS